MSLPEDPEHRRLGDTGDQIHRFVREGNMQAAINVWESLTVREQRLLVLSFSALIDEYRRELGQDATS